MIEKLLFTVTNKYDNQMRIVLWLALLSIMKNSLALF